MKSIRIILLFAGICLTQDASATPTPRAQDKTEHCYEPNAKKTYGFELRNLSDKDVLLTLRNGNEDIIADMRVVAGAGKKPKEVPIVRLSKMNFNINKPSTITIVDAKSMKKLGVYQVNQAGKTVFVFWKDNNLNLQTGAKSVSGLSLSNNAKDIKKIE